MRGWIAILGGVGLVLGAAWWFTTRSRPTERQFDFPAAERAPAPDEPPITLLDDPDAPPDETSVAAIDLDAARVSLVTETVAPPSATIDVAKQIAPFAFVVVDERSGLRLPRYLVRISDEAGRQTEVVTDDAGAGQIDELAIGPIVALAVDHPARRDAPQKIVLEHVAGLSPPHELYVESGATYPLEFGPAAGPDVRRIEVRITLENEDGDSGSSNFEPVRAEAPFCREGELPWVRLPARNPAWNRAKRLEARSQDGLWAGAAPATVVQGLAPEAVRLELSVKSALAGTVTCAGAPVAGVNVVFRAESRPDGKRGYSGRARTDANGRYRIEFAEPGAGQVTVASLLHEPERRDVVLAGGAARREDFELDSIPTVGRISGLIVSESGTYETKLDVALSQAGKKGADAPDLRAKVRWKTVDGRRVGQFDFGLLPRGKYRLDCGRPDWLEWTPRVLEIEAPKEDVLVRVADTTLRADFVFEIRDADNGLALDRSHLVLETTHGEKLDWVDSGAVVLRGYPEEAKLRWRLDKAGYPSRSGDSSSFAETTLVDGRRRRTCRIELRPGWSELFRVIDSRNRKAVAGAVVKIDGQEAGRSDKNGYVRLEAREKPASVTVELAGWRQVGGVDLRPPAQRKWSRFVDIQLRPTNRK